MQVTLQLSYRPNHEKFLIVTVRMILVHTTYSQNQLVQSPLVNPRGDPLPPDAQDIPVIDEWVNTWEGFIPYLSLCRDGCSCFENS